MREMTKTEAKELLKAVDGLIAYYRYENDEYKYYCPFCSRCEECLWMRFSKMKCCEYSNRYFSTYYSNELRRQRLPRWVKLSLKRLARWRARLVGIIGEKEE